MSSHSSTSPSSNGGVTVVLPNIRTSKRRVVANSNRKRALFSCDRCKIKKIACQRVSEDGLLHDSKTPCIHCKKLNVECKTTIKRKKRVHGPIENIGLHYKCLITIMKGLYPEKDINNIDTLIDLGESLSLKMPSRDGITKEEEEDLKDIAILLTSSKRIKHSNQIIKKEEDYEEEDDEEEGDEVESPGDKKPQKSTTDDRVIVDHGGNTHYIGPLGAPAMASKVFAILLRNSNDKLNLLSMTKLQKESQNREGIINSKQVPLNSYMFRSLDLENFPLLNMLNKNELDFYVKVFFNRIHPLWYLFKEEEFMKAYEIFWLMLSNGKLQKTKLSNSQICCIYMVWILGRQVEPFPSLVVQFDDYLINRYVDVIKITLSEILLTPSLDGIRCMIMLSIYMDNNKRRESGYVLLECLARQLISIGLNRRSLTMHVKNDLKLEEMKNTWWVLFKNELRFSNQMGRPTCLHIEDINVEAPTFEDPVFQAYVEEDIKLNKIMYGLLQYRKKLFLNYELLSLVNVEKLMNLKKAFNQWLEELPASLKYDVDPKLYKSSLMLQYHYYFITLSLPFILYSSVHNDLKLSNDDPILDLICQCVKSSISIAELMTFIDNNGFFNGTIYIDLFYCYHATMALVLFYLLLHKTQKFDKAYIEAKYGISLSTMNDSLQLIKIMNTKNIDSIKGSLLTISELIDVMIADLEIIIRANPNNDTQLLQQIQQPHVHHQMAMDTDSMSDISTVQQFPYTPHENTNLGGNANFDFNFNFAIDNQMVLDNDMIDLLFGNDLFGVYHSENNT